MARSERMLISPRPPMACSLSLPRTENSASPFFEAARGNVDVVDDLRATRLKLATRPSCTESALVMKTIGIVVVAALTASAAAVPNGVTITVTRCWIRSAASFGSRSLSVFA